MGTKIVGICRLKTPGRETMDSREAAGGYLAAAACPLPGHLSGILHDMRFDLLHLFSRFRVCIGDPADDPGDIVIFQDDIHAFAEINVKKYAT